MSRDCDVAVIGGGVAGLTAAAYLARAGLDVILFEQQHRVGGLAGAFTRGDYLFEQSLQWLVGCHPGGTLSVLRDELELSLTFKRMDPFRRHIGPGFDILLSSHLQDWTGELCRLFPTEASAIQRLVKDAVRMARRSTELPKKPQEMMTTWEKLRVGVSATRNLKLFGKYAGINIQDFIVQTFQNPQLRTFFYSLYPVGSASTVLLLTMIGWLRDRQLFYPVGGGQAIVDALTGAVRDAGGEIRCGERVSGILVENETAVGVTLTRGDEVRSDYVVAACDARQLYDTLLPQEVVPEDVLADMAEWEPWPSYFLLCLGVDDSVTELPHWHHHITYCPALMDAMESDDPRQWLLHIVDNGTADTVHAPPHQRSLAVGAKVAFNYRHRWETIGEMRGAEYTAVKNEVADSLLASAERLLPGLRAHIRVAEVATPNTYRRYTGNWQGAMKGWLPTPEVLSHVKRERTDIERLFQCGHWHVHAGSVGAAAQSGKNAALLIIQERHGK